MACLEHLCIECGNLWFSNNLDTACPKCGSTEVDSKSDELTDEEG